MDLGQDRRLEELEVAVKKFPHVSVLALGTIEQNQVETREKEKQGFAKMFDWESSSKNLPSILKLSLLAMTLHKSRKYCAILDLSSKLMFAGYLLLSVNYAIQKCAQEEAMDQT